MSDGGEERSDFRSLKRIAWWGSAAVGALLAAVAAVTSQSGSARITTAVQGTPKTTASVPPRPMSEEPDARRLAELVRSLTADRDRLLMRMTALERNLQDVTGSVSRMNEAPAAAPGGSLLTAGPSFMGTITAPQTVAAFPSTRIATGHAAANGKAPAPESVGTITEFGIDIGGGQSVEGMRELWMSARATHGGLFDGLRPVIAVRDTKPGGSAELRLVLGPLSNANAAAKLCASLAASGWTCRPAVFDGQRLALR